MKQLSIFALAAAGLLMASCSQEDVQAPGNGGNFTVKVQLPADMATRAPVVPTTDEYGQGYAAQELLYFVYECDEDGVIDHLVTQGNTQFDEGSLEKEVSFNLANGKYYQLAFFAESPQAKLQNVYEVDAENTTITVNYENMVYATNNVDGYDCFYRLYATDMIGGPTTNTSPTVYLFRPVAQINWGTNDLLEPVVTDDNAFGPGAANTIETYFTADVYTQFDMVTCNVKGVVSTQEFEAMSVPSIYNFPVNGYSYLAMQYVLAPAAENNLEEGGYIYDLDLNVSSTNGSGHSVDVTVDNAPVQANWRTNIYGSLLTDNFHVYVVKEPTFWGEYNLGEWDGQSVTMPQKDSEGIYHVNAPSDLAGLAQMVANGDVAAGDSFQLNADLDFGGHVFAGIGEGALSSNTTTTGNVFNGTFDGQNHTISNIVIEGAAKSAAGFFNTVGKTGVVKDVNFTNVNIQGGTSADGINATTGVVGFLDGGTVENVTVSGKVSGTNNVAGVVGSALYGEITDCTNNATVTAAWQVGGVVGTSSADVTGCTNNGKITATGNSVGGVVAEQDPAGTVTKCNNTGDVLASANSVGVGGIVGWIRYLGSDGTTMSSISVTYCENSGNVKGGNSVAGIVGRWSWGGNCSNNTNTAQYIAGTDCVAGIVGLTSADRVNVPGINGTLTINDNTSSTADLSGKNVWTINYNAYGNATFSGNTPANAAVN